MQLTPTKKAYFLSDFHLGVPNAAASRQREKLIVEFLDTIKTDAQIIFLVGDLFDFWFEYRRVVPKGYVRLLGKLAELSDAGIQLHLFVGNHDMWMKHYFEEEMNITTYFEPKVFDINGYSFYIGHGDGLGPGDKGYKAMKKVFRSPACQWLFGLLPPVIGMGLANYFSGKSRGEEHHPEEKFLGEEKEWLIIYSKEVLQQTFYHFFVFGHRHLPIDYRLLPPYSPRGETPPHQTLPVGEPANETESSQSGPRSDASANPPLGGGGAARYINLGEWMNYQTYAVFDGVEMQLKSYTGKEDKIVRHK